MEANVNVESDAWSIGRLLAWTTDFLRDKGIEESRLSTEVLLAHALGCQRIELYARFDQIPQADQVSLFRDWVRRASQHEPIAYLVQHKEFFSLPFHVTSDVLIPRPETETLVECVIDYCQSEGLSAPELFDFGTGSGCIAIALLTQMKEAKVLASDISEAALDVARRNGERHEVHDRLTLVPCDGPGLESQCVPEKGFDVLVSNPPYVAANDVGQLDDNVRDYEPHCALTDGNDGQMFYRAIASEAPRLLHANGAIFVEIEDNKTESVLASMTSDGVLKHIDTWKDRVTGKDRVLQFSRVETA